MKIYRNLLLLIIAITASCQKVDTTERSFLELVNKITELNFSEDGGERYINLRTNIEEIVVETNHDWVSYTYDKIKKQVVVSLTQNYDPEIRSSKIVIKGEDKSIGIDINQLGITPSILFDSESIKVNFESQTVTLSVTSNIEVSLNTNADWISIPLGKNMGSSTKLYDIHIDEMASDPRSAYVYASNPNTTLKDSIKISQTITGGKDYSPSGEESFIEDEKLPVSSVELVPPDEFQPGEGASNTLGNPGVLYSTPWYGQFERGKVIELIYTMDASVDIVNYLVLTPRSSGLNGVFKTGEVHVKAVGSSTFVKVCDFSGEANNDPLMVNFETPILNPEKIKLRITDTYSHDSDYHVTLDEFAAYKSVANTNILLDSQFFTDDTYSELVPGFTINDLKLIQNPFLKNVASFLLSGNYSKYRIVNAEAYMPLVDLRDVMFTSYYNKYENITGIYFTKGEKAVLFVGETNGEALKLRVKNFDQGEEEYVYSIIKGINIIEMKGSGNAYISYFTSNHNSALPVKIHIASGSVNGYVDLNTTTEQQAQEILAAAKGSIMDLKSDIVHLAYPKQAILANSNGNIMGLLESYDKIINIQYKIMGLRKYNSVPKNRMFGRVVWNGYMFADGIGAGFNNNTMSSVANVSQINTGEVWGIAHEFGHVNQVRPGMKWLGMGEVTNNIYSTYTQYAFNPNYLRLEHEYTNSVPGGEFEAGGRFNAFYNSAMIDKSPYLTLWGPDANSTGSRDHFVHVAPLWQLTLFFEIVNNTGVLGNDNFWADIFEKVRNTDQSVYSNGELEINFTKNLMDVVKLDLSEFFTEIGIYRPIDKTIDDYGTGTITVTQQMIDDAKVYASKYQKPDSKIQYISGNCINAYRNKLPVVGVYNQGISGTTTKTINHSVWKNVAVFKTYNGSNLLRITMVGTNDPSNNSTQVKYPSEATRIEAVAYDGTETLVFGVR